VTALVDGAFAARKKLCTGGVSGRIDGSGETQIARISANRFAQAVHSPTIRRTPRRVCAYDSHRARRVEQVSDRLRRAHRRGVEPPHSNTDLLL
jgi:hypothetical protein